MLLCDTFGWSAPKVIYGLYYRFWLPSAKNLHAQWNRILQTVLAPTCSKMQSDFFVLLTNPIVRSIKVKLEVNLKSDSAQWWSFTLSGMPIKITKCMLWCISSAIKAVSDIHLMLDGLRNSQPNKTAWLLHTFLKLIPSKPSTSKTLSVKTDRSVFSGVKCPQLNCEDILYSNVCRGTFPKTLRVRTEVTLPAMCLYKRV